MLRAMMEKTIQDGTGIAGQIPGYRAAGKTGTAQKVDPDTGAYSPNDYIANFVGFAPVNDPSIVVVVAIDSPEGGHYGGPVAAPVFSATGRAGAALPRRAARSAAGAAQASAQANASRASG